MIRRIRRVRRQIDWFIFYYNPVISGFKGVSNPSNPSNVSNLYNLNKEYNLNGG